MSRRWITLVCVLVPALALAAGLRKVTAGWDDGAITAAFARTFAETGRIALTPSSEQVEGFSSLSWFLVVAAGCRFLHSFTAVLAWTKIASAACFAAALFSFRRVAERFVDVRSVPFAVLLLAFVVTPLNEAINGMEMNLAMLLTLLLVEDLYRWKLRPAARFGLAALLSGGLLATRFEAPFLLFFLYLGTWLARRDRGILSALVAANAVEFGAMEVWRHKVFGLWLPNTIVAKLWEPYRPHGLGEILAGRYGATAEIFTVLSVPLLVLLALVLVCRVSLGGWTKARVKLRLSPLVLWLTVGSILLGLGMGQNWGHPGRMILSFLPFVVLAIVSSYEAFAEVVPAAVPVLIPTVVLLHLCAWIPLAVNAAHENLTSARKVLPIGMAAERVRTMLGKDTLTALIPDVGASALCCERLQIFDAGLLANRFLAQHGPGAMGEFLQQNRPDLIETHSPWGGIERMYTAELAKEYGLVRVNGVFLLLRRDLYAELIARGAREMPVIDGSGFCGSMPFPPSENLLYFVGLQHCIAIPAAR